MLYVFVSALAELASFCPRLAKCKGSGKYSGVNVQCTPWASRIVMTSISWLFKTDSVGAQFIGDAGIQVHPNYHPFTTALVMLGQTDLIY